MQYSCIPIVYTNNETSLTAKGLSTAGSPNGLSSNPDISVCFHFYFLFGGSYLFGMEVAWT